MRNYLGSAQDSFRTFNSKVRVLFHHLNTSFLRFVGMLVVLLGSSALAGWGYATFATPQHSSTHDTLAQGIDQPGAVRVPALSTVDAEAKSETKSNGAPSTHSTDLSVNGQTVPVPVDGSVHKEITTKNSTTTVDVSSHTASTGAAQSTFKMQLKVNTSTDSPSTP